MTTRIADILSAEAELDLLLAEQRKLDDDKLRAKVAAAEQRLLWVKKSWVGGDR
jgi:hypothetical protein